jgi:hypothetical protein
LTDETSPPNGASRDIAPGEGQAAAPSTADAPGTRAPGGPSSEQPASPCSRPVQYKGADLDSERGPGLGCFWIQVVLLAIFVPLTPISVSLGWPFEASAFLLFATIGLLLLTGQTVIFLLRLVGADRRGRSGGSGGSGRRRPLASRTPTVGELEDARTAETANGDSEPLDGVGPANAPTGSNPDDDVRQ